MEDKSAELKQLNTRKQRARDGDEKAQGLLQKRAQVPKEQLEDRPKYFVEGAGLPREGEEEFQLRIISAPFGMCCGLQYFHRDADKQIQYRRYIGLPVLGHDG